MNKYDLLNWNMNPQPVPSIYNEGYSQYETLSKLLYNINQYITNMNTAKEELDQLKEIKLDIETFLDDLKNKRKLDEVGNFTGSWFGITHPTQSEEGLATAVLDLQDLTGSHTTQISNNSTHIGDLESQVGALASGSPKGVFPTLGDLQADVTANTEDGKKHTYLVNADGKWYYWSGSAWSAGGIYQASNVADNTITPKKTTFFVIGKNRFNKATVNTGYYVNYADGALVANSQYSASDYIAVDGSTQYTMATDASLRIAYYDSNKVFISGSNAGVQTITTPSNCKFVRYSFTSGTLNTQQFEQNSSSTTYASYTGDYIDPTKYMLDNTIDGVKTKDGTITPSKTSFFALDTTLNLFDGNYVANKLTGTTGSIQYSLGDSNCKTAIIKINPNTQYSFIRTTPSRFNYGTATKLLAVGEYLDGSLNQNNSGSGETTTPSYITFTSGASDQYLYINVTTTGRDVFLQVVQGSQSAFTISHYPLNPKDVNVYSRDEVYTKAETLTKINDTINGKIATNVFSKTGDVCTIRMGKAQYVFKRVTDTGINVDAWRLYQGDLINPANNNAVVGNMWTNSDAEGAIQIYGEDDFVSGYHGDEIYSNINILIDGNPINISLNYSDTAFNNITVTSESVVYHCNTSAQAGVKAFDRVKTLTFQDDTVRINNRYTCASNLVINRGALALFNCYKTYNSTKFFKNYWNNNDLKMWTVADLDEQPIPTASDKMTEVCFYTTIGTIDFKILRGQENSAYSGYVVNFSDQNRMKIYFDYIKSVTGGTSVTTGQVLQTDFQFTIK